MTENLPKNENHPALQLVVARMMWTMYVTKFWSVELSSEQIAQRTQIFGY